jgi:hypothetical protein
VTDIDLYEFKPEDINDDEPVNFTPKQIVYDSELTDSFSRIDTTVEDVNDKSSEIPGDLSSSALPEAENNAIHFNAEDINDNGAFCVAFKPAENESKLTVSFSRIEKEIDTDTVFPYYSYLCTIRKEDKILQSFEVESNLDLIPSYIDFSDIDFDGYLDMSVVVSEGVANRVWNYYRYDVKHKVFEITPFFSVWGRGIELFYDTNQIITTGGSGGFYEREMYQYASGEYTLLRREYADWEDYNIETYNLHIVQIDADGNETEIFSTILTQDEYYGDLSVRDSYLRFGANESRKISEKTDSK